MLLKAIYFAEIFKSSVTIIITILLFLHTVVNVSFPSNQPTQLSVFIAFLEGEVFSKFNLSLLFWNRRVKNCRVAFVFYWFSFTVREFVSKQITADLSTVSQSYNYLSLSSLVKHFCHFVFVINIEKSCNFIIYTVSILQVGWNKISIGRSWCNYYFYDGAILVDSSCFSRSLLWSCFLHYCSTVE